MRNVTIIISICFCTTLPSFAVDKVISPAQIEADWLCQEKYHLYKPLLTHQESAGGGCDGIINGKFGFESGIAREPWWQVDLGTSQPIDRVVIWNRCDEHAKQARNLKIYLSQDNLKWRESFAYEGESFYGFSDNKPLIADLKGRHGRYVRIRLLGTRSISFDEIQVFGMEQPDRNLALGRPADLSGLPQSCDPNPLDTPVKCRRRIEQILSHCRRLAGELTGQGIDAALHLRAMDMIADKLKSLPEEKIDKQLYFQARWIQRHLTLANPVLNFDDLLFVKRVPGSYSHMSDQYYGWWSRPGGGIYVLHDFKSDTPILQCLTDSFKEPGSFLRPMISYDGQKVLFAWCKYYPNLAAEKDKLNKENVPQDAFYHVFEMNVDGTGLHQLTDGKYDDFDARYLPDGNIVFLSTRRGQFIQCGPESSAQTLAHPDLPDSYVRCGGGPFRPVPIYTLHTMKPDGTRLCAISPFENFEWTPSVAADGSLLYMRWDYVDRYNQPWMSLWSMNPDGTNARIVYGNFTDGPNCTFEPRSVPDSNKIIFTGSAHHSQTMGSLVLLDQTVGSEGKEPLTRLTPEVPFPEAESWPTAFYANPWPLSERFYLTAWGEEKGIKEGTHRIANGMGLYFFDAAGNKELLYRDPAISCATPIPLQPRQKPPLIASNIDWNGPREGNFLLLDVYNGLKTVKPGQIKALRIIAIPPKTQPQMHNPPIGLTKDDPGKCVLGTVPVEEDGSAFFRVPASVIVFFQALDERGMAIQTMRSAASVQPGQTSSCIGCHESRHQAPPAKRVLAASRPPSKITVGPEGSWPLRFEKLVQPVLDKNCVSCHNPDNTETPRAAAFVLTPEKAFESMVHYGQPSLYEHVRQRYYEGSSQEAACGASRSELLAKINDPKGHHGLKLAPPDLERLIVWMDTYAQKAGSFCLDQERRLLKLRQNSHDLLIERNQNQNVLTEEFSSSNQ